MRFFLGEETHHRKEITKDANAALGGARALRNLFRRGLPVPDGGEDIELNGGLQGGSLLVGVKSLEKPPGVGHGSGRRRRSRHFFLGFPYNFTCYGLAHWKSSLNMEVTSLWAPPILAVPPNTQIPRLAKIHPRKDRI